MAEKLPCLYIPWLLDLFLSNVMRHFVYGIHQDSKNLGSKLVFCPNYCHIGLMLEDTKLLHQCESMKTILLIVFFSLWKVQMYETLKI